MQESVETPGEFVVARSDATKLLESIEETFNQMARLVAMPVGCPPSRSCASLRSLQSTYGGTCTRWNAPTLGSQRKRGYGMTVTP